MRSSDAGADYSCVGLGSEAKCVSKRRAQRAVLGDPPSVPSGPLDIDLEALFQPSLGASQLHLHRRGI